MQVAMVDRVSIVIPVLNEEIALPATLECLQLWRPAGHEVIVVDGGSEDQTLTVAQPLADCVLKSMPGRARQMNRGAAVAAGEWLLFLHADTLLPAVAIDAIRRVPAHRTWGCFDVRLSGLHPLLRWVEAAIDWRSRLTGIATGDQAVFVRRNAFRAVGGFPEIELMEDIALSRLLRDAHGWPACLPERVITSSRRWERSGILRTVVKMWCLRLGYAMGMRPQRLARWYEMP
ncbi:MAG: TIGR04283 family arsenosugar biosynthesis glycosyltransferase [Chromatiales bacterium]